MTVSEQYVKWTIDKLRNAAKEWNTMHWIDCNTLNNDFLTYLQAKKSVAVEGDWLTQTRQTLRVRRKKVGIGYYIPSQEYIDHAIDTFKPDVIAFIGLWYSFPSYYKLVHVEPVWDEETTNFFVYKLSKKAKKRIASRICS